MVEDVLPHFFDEADIADSFGVAVFDWLMSLIGESTSLGFQFSSSSLLF